MYKFQTGPPPHLVQFASTGVVECSWRNKTPRLKVSPARYFHTGAIMTPGMASRGRSLGSTLVPGLLMIIYDATL